MAFNKVTVVRDPVNDSNQQDWYFNSAEVVLGQTRIHGAVTYQMFITTDGKTWYFKGTPGQLKAALGL